MKIAAPSLRPSNIVKDDGGPQRQKGRELLRGDSRIFLMGVAQGGPRTSRGGPLGKSSDMT